MCLSPLYRTRHGVIMMYSMAKDVDVPKRKTIESAGYDFYMPYDLDLEPGEEYLIGTKICFSGTEMPYIKADIVFDDSDEVKACTIIPKQWSMKLYPHSSLGDNFGFRLKNTTGLIDKDYTDHQITAKISVTKPLSLKKGDRFMQGELTPVLYFDGEDEPTQERKGGKGSTGVSDGPQHIEIQSVKKVEEPQTDNINQMLTAVLGLAPIVIGSILNANSNERDAPQNAKRVAQVQDIVSKTIDTINDSGILEYVSETAKRRVKTE